MKHDLLVLPMSENLRSPAVAGYFYPADKNGLLHEIDNSFRNSKIGPGISFSNRLTESKEVSLPRVRVVECFVVPHAGYQYSGPVAAHSYATAYDMVLSKYPVVTAIVLGPNHYGIGSGISLSPSVGWETPLGILKVNKVISNEIAEASDIIDTDSLAHSREHSIEVQVPFLQYLSTKCELTFVPLCLMLQDKDSIEDVARAIFSVISSREHERESFLILGSSDLTHYETQSKASSQDAKLLDKVEYMDLPSFYTTLERENVTSCGYGAIAVAMEVSKRLGKTKGEVLKYATSGDVSGDKSSVVGYSAVHFV